MLCLVHQLHFGTLGIGSVSSTLQASFLVLVHLVHFGTLYVWYTGWYTKCVGRRFIGTSSSFFIGTLRSFLVIWGTIGTVVTFGTPVAFGTLRIGSVFSALSIILSQFWTFGTFCLVHLTFGTPVGTLSVFVGISSSFFGHWYNSWSFSARLVQLIRRYTSCVWYSKLGSDHCLVHSTSFLVILHS